MGIWLPWRQYTRNSWPNASTKKSHLNSFGIRTPGPSTIREANIPDINNRLARIKEAREEAQHALKQVQEKMIRKQSSKASKLEIKYG